MGSLSFKNAENCDQRQPKLFIIEGARRISRDFVAIEFQFRRD
jgi:hypothetical protein